jgi:hypothetical protein
MAVGVNEQPVAAAERANEMNARRDTGCVMGAA